MPFTGHLNMFSDALQRGKSRESAQVSAPIENIKYWLG